MMLNPTRQQGFTLVEALIAILIVAGGLVGIASLQLEAMQAAHAAQQRSFASVAAQDAVDRLWFESADPDDWNAMCGASSNASASGSGPLHDVWTAWRRNWSSHLPGFSGDIAPVGTGCQFAITVAWDDSRFVLDPESMVMQSDGSMAPEREDVATLTYTAHLPSPTTLGEDT